LSCTPAATANEILGVVCNVGYTASYASGVGSCAASTAVGAGISLYATTTSYTTVTVGDSAN